MTGQPMPDSTRPPSRAVQRLVDRYRAEGAGAMDDETLVGIAWRTVRVRRQVIAAFASVVAVVAGIITLLAGPWLVGAVLIAGGLAAGLVNLGWVAVDHGRIRH